MWAGPHQAQTVWSKQRRVAAIRTALLLEDTVERVIALSLVANGTADGHIVHLAGDDLAVVVDLGNGDLDRSVVLGLNQAASGSALARHEKVDELALVSRPRTWSFSMVVQVGKSSGLREVSSSCHVIITVPTRDKHACGGVPCNTMTDVRRELTSTSITLMSKWRACHAPAPLSVCSRAWKVRVCG